LASWRDFSPVDRSYATQNTIEGAVQVARNILRSRWNSGS